MLRFELIEKRLAQEQSLTDNSMTAMKVKQMKSTLLGLGHQADYINIQGRCNNIKSHGIQEEPSESRDSIKSKCLEFFRRELDLTTGIA